MSGKKQWHWRSMSEWLIEESFRDQIWKRSWKKITCYYCNPGESAFAPMPSVGSRRRHWRRRCCRRRHFVGAARLAGTAGRSPAAAATTATATTSTTTTATTRTTTAAAAAAAKEYARAGHQHRDGGADGRTGGGFVLLRAAVQGAARAAAHHRPDATDADARQWSLLPLFVMAPRRRSHRRLLLHFKLCWSSSRYRPKAAGWKTISKWLLRRHSGLPDEHQVISVAVLFPGARRNSGYNERSNLLPVHRLKFKIATTRSWGNVRRREISIKSPFMPIR